MAKMRSRRRPKPEAAFRAAWNVFEAFADELTHLLEEVREGETARAKKLAPAIGDLARAVARVAEEGGRLSGEKRAGGRTGGNDDTSPSPLDLDAARGEVCRRLARLRSSG